MDGRAGYCGETGHRSERAVRKYKRSCLEVSENGSKILDPPAPKVLETETVALCGENTHVQETACASNLSETKLESIEKTENRVTTHLTNRGFKFENCKISFNF